MPEAATRGPAYLDTIEGVAHKDPKCPVFADAVASAKADEGEMTGFVWCSECGNREFIDSEDW